MIFPMFQVLHNSHSNKRQQNVTSTYEQNEKQRNLSYLFSCDFVVDVWITSFGNCIYKDTLTHSQWFPSVASAICARSLDSHFLSMLEKIHI